MRKMLEIVMSVISVRKRALFTVTQRDWERMQQKIKEMLIKIKDVLVSVWHSYKRMRQENNIYFNILVLCFLRLSEQVYVWWQMRGKQQLYVR